MIGYIQGQLKEWLPDGELLIVAGGVGYSVFSMHSAQSVDTVSKRSLTLGGTVEVFVHTHVREDQLSLFGFVLPEEREIFRELLKVNGVGPKLALQILSSTTLGDFSSLVERDDIKALTQLPKVGKKTAEQIVLTLKGKLQPYLSRGGDLAGTGQDGRELLGQIISALSHLGYKSQDIDRVKPQFEQAQDLASGVRLALQAMSQRLGG